MKSVGTLLELINNGGGELVCCGKPMVKLDPNTFDASTEKHVPAAEKEKTEKFTLQLAPVEHPMTEEHI